MRKPISLFCIFLYASLFSFSFYTETSGPHIPLPNMLTEIYLLEGCGITASQALSARNEFNPNGHVNDSKSFGSTIHVITSVDNFPNTGVLIRREIGNEFIDPPLLMVTRNPLPGKYLIIIEEAYLTPTYANLLHEYGHVVGLGHTDISSAVMYDTSNSTTSLYQDDKNGLYAQYCKPSFTIPSEQMKLLRGDNRNLSIGFNPINKTTPSLYQIDTWDNASPGDQRQHLISCENVYGSNSISYVSNDWDTSELTTGLHKLKLYVWGSEDCTGNYNHNQYHQDVLMDELEVMLYDLKLRSPEYNKEYSIYGPLEFKVFGKSNNEEISITEITNIGSVEYLLENGWGLNIFPLTPTDISTNFEFTKDLSSISGLSTGTYYVSAYVRDLQGELIAEIEEMPIRINTRSIQIQDPTTDEFMIYDFDLPSWYYTTFFVISGKFYHEGLDNKDFTIPSPAELYDVKWCEENNMQASVYSTDYPSELRVPDGTYAWSMDKWPGSKSSSSVLNGNSDLYAESLNLQDSTHQGSLPMKDEQGANWVLNTYLNLRPGLYTFLGNMYDKKDYQSGIYTKLAETDTLQFLIPSWKMKTRIDPRYGNDRIHFRKTEDIEVCIWRPVSGLQANDTQVYLYDENKVTLLDSRTVTYSGRIGTSQAISFSTNNLEYGFYNLVAVETDYDTGIEVKFEKEIQVCPFYVNWESGGAWPSDWPGLTDGYWRIDSFVNNDPLVKSYSIENYYNYTTETEVLMNETKYSQGVQLTKPYDAFMQIYIGLKRVNNYFKTLQAVYQVAISVDNQVTWDILKTANAEEWATYDWPDIYDRWCFANTETTIKNTNEPIYIRLTGIDPHGTLRDTTFTEGAGYDEIMIAYTKEEILEGPENIAAQFYTASKYDAVQLTWDNSPDYEAGRYYRVYRDGRLIGNMISDTSFLDYTTEPDKMYNYIVTLYDQTLASCGAVYESPKAGNSVDFYTGLLSPSGLSITDESPNIRLTWSPVSGASGYKVYSSNDPYGTFSENTTGTFNGEEWVAPLIESKLFYYVVAVNENKKVIKILRNSGNQVR